MTILTLASLVGALLWVELEGNASAASATPDKIVYSQQNGRNGTYLQYVPGDGSKPTTQPVTGAGGCATPNTTNPVLAFSAVSYPNGYANPSTPAIVGAYNNRTGVCAVTPAWAVDVSEGLIFAPGPNALTTGRVFSRAVLQLERQDKAGGTLSGQAVLRVGTSQVGALQFTITNGQITFDTQNVPTGFTSLELRVLTPSAGSLSVVGPTSTFTFASQICPGDTISDTSTDGTISAGQVTAHITYVAGSACKSYTFFEASATDGNSADGKSITFTSQELVGAHITATFDWGYTPLCRADATLDPSVPPCPTTYVDFGGGAQPQTYCAEADPNNTSTPWCTTSKHVDYVLDPGGSGETVAHITETWEGFGDPYFRR
jgi:hypothetical protein